MKAGGALVVGLSSRRGTPAAPQPTRSNRAAPPDLGQVDSFIAIHADNTASVKTGRVELGQGTTTGLLLLVAEELDMDVGQLVVVRHDTNVTPNTGGTYGQQLDRGRRAAGCAVPRPRRRQALLGLASAELGVPVASLTVSGGVVSGGGRRSPTASCVGGRLLNVAMASPRSIPASLRRSLWRPTASSGRSRAAARHSGQGDRHLHLRPRHPRARDAARPARAAVRSGRLRRREHAGIVSVDERSIAGIGDARIVRRGDFLGVVASKEFDAIQAAAQLKVEYATPPEISGQRQPLVDRCARSTPPARRRHGSWSTPATSRRGSPPAAHTVSASYAYHYQGHMPIGPELRGRRRDRERSARARRTRRTPT